MKAAPKAKVKAAPTLIAAKIPLVTPLPPPCPMPTAPCISATLRAFTCRPTSTRAICALTVKTWYLLAARTNTAYPSPCKPRPRTLRPSRWWTTITPSSKRALKTWAFRSTSIRAPQRPCMPKRLPTFSKPSTKKAVLKKRPLCNTTTKKTISFWPTATLPAPVRTAATKRPTATSARNAAPPSAPTNSSIPSRPLAATAP